MDGVSHGFLDDRIQAKFAIAYVCTCASFLGRDACLSLFLAMSRYLPVKLYMQHRAIFYCELSFQACPHVARFGLECPDPNATGAATLPRQRCCYRSVRITPGQYVERPIFGLRICCVGSVVLRF